MERGEAPGGALQDVWADRAGKGLGRTEGVPCQPTCGVLPEQIWVSFLDVVAWGPLGVLGPSVGHLVWSGRARPQPQLGVPRPGRRPAPTQDTGPHRAGLLVRVQLWAALQPRGSRRWLVLWSRFYLKRPRTLHQSPDPGRGSFLQEPVWEGGRRPQGQAQRAAPSGEAGAVRGARAGGRGRGRNVWEEALPAPALPLGWPEKKVIRPRVLIPVGITHQHGLSRSRPPGR